MTKEERIHNEDVAAKLMGKVVCTQCQGTGKISPVWRGSNIPDDQEIAEAVMEELKQCWACKGTRWVMPGNQGYQG